MFYLESRSCLSNFNNSSTHTFGTPKMLHILRSIRTACKRLVGLSLKSGVLASFNKFFILSSFPSLLCSSKGTSMLAISSSSSYLPSSSSSMPSLCDVMFARAGSPSYILKHSFTIQTTSTPSLLSCIVSVFVYGNMSPSTSLSVLLFASTVM